jgi:SAM-dependent MidA family methyltransferase
MATLVVAVDQALGHPGRLDIVDVGAGDGSLLVGLLAALPREVVARTQPVAVELRERPPGLPTQIHWGETLPGRVVGLVIAHEYLDNVPVDVVEADDQLRQVLVDPVSGTEGLGPPPTVEQTRWLASWWPITEPGERAEVGSFRDAAWMQLVDQLERGLALAVDYGHLRGERMSGSVPLGTLTGYRDGHQVIPVPDGSCDITAHVAMDSCQEAGTRAGADSSALLLQRDALRALGLDTPLPAIELAHNDPPAYVEALSRASHAAELLDPTSLGSFWWLLQAKACQPTISGVHWE